MRQPRPAPIEIRDTPLPPLPTPPLPLPEDEDYSDCESEVSDYNDDGFSTRPVRSSFRSSFRNSFRNSILGHRTSIIRAPRDLEEGAASNNSSSTTLTEDSPKSFKELKPQPLASEKSLFEIHGLDGSPIPPKKGTRLYRYLRWNFGSVYRRIFCLAYLGNMTALAVLIAQHATSDKKFTYQQASIAVAANILASLLVRNEHIVNAMFWVFGTWTKNLPLWLRGLAAKVYSYGGIHSGAAVAGTFWYIAFLMLLTLDFQTAGSLSIIRSYIYFVSYFILLLLISMIISAHPHLRRVMHNWFEGIHRFMGWLAILAFWAQTMLLAADANNTSAFGKALLVSPNVWMLVVITLLVIYPWTRLRLRDVEAEVLSDHCVKLNFKYRNVHYGQAIRLTDAPLKETHAFGVIPFPTTPAAPSQPTTIHCPGCICHATPQPTPCSNRTSTLSLTDLKAHVRSTPSRLPPTTSSSPSGKGFSVIVSSAGDWTRRIIASPPTQIYTRGTPQFGVLRVAGLFSPCLLIATGSGIAPILSLLVQHPSHPVRILWSTKDPIKTFGREVVETVYRADPEAVVIDTNSKSKGGNKRPDLVGLAWRVMEQGRARKGCEAAVVISNQRVTRKVVYGLESRGGRAYGAIFDS